MSDSGYLPMRELILSGERSFMSSANRRLRRQEHIAGSRVSTCTAHLLLVTMTMNKKSILRWFQIMALMLSAAVAHAQATAFEEMLEELLEDSVPAIDVKALEKKLTESAAPILLDAREPDEYAVSHLEGAKNIGFEEFDLKALAGIDKDAPIVIYCSVGYRSEKIGETLQKAGYKNVVNLRGGIFDWANQKLPLVNEQEETVTSVHPYDEDWGKWLADGISSEVVAD